MCKNHRSTGRAFRRSMRQKAVKHAFDVYYNWSHLDWQHSFLCHKYGIEIGANKWQYQDENRTDIFATAVKTADNLKCCSCYLCSGAWRGYKDDIRQMYAMSVLKDDFQDFQDFLVQPGKSVVQYE